MEEQRKAEEQFAKYPSLEDRVVLITGGSSGIGELLVEAFTLQRAQVVFLHLADDDPSALIDRLTPNAAHAPAYFQCDLTNSAHLAETLAGIVARFGTIDVVINNSSDNAPHSTTDASAEFNERCNAIDRKHELFVSQAAVPGIKWQGRGLILNMSAISWMVPSNGVPVYAASKAAIVDLTRTLARELGPHGVRVNCLLPGAVETARQRRNWYSEEYANEILSQPAVKRLLQPDEVARLALFLAADDSSAITNQSYVTDGGWI